ncbi:hypothetical protein, partial [Escherichia coli]|uniref:hypothetical protein n=1 Tax=Escherichia coli TaxID=562 RepID=UPI003CEE5946
MGKRQVTRLGFFFLRLAESSSSESCSMRLIACCLLASLTAGAVTAQQRPVLTDADYSRAVHQLGPWT